jgi:uncharacterized protein
MTFSSTPSRVYPGEPVGAPLGIARARGPVYPGEPADVGDVGEPAVVEGVKGEWRVDPSLLGQPFSGRAVLLSPSTGWCTTASALPSSLNSTISGKLDATADRKGGVLRVDAIHEDVTFNKTMTAAVDREIKDLARWLELDLTLPG